MRRLLNDSRTPPLAASVFLAALSLYWIFERVRRGEDECIDRPIVSGIVSEVWLGAAALIAWVPVARPSERAALRWLVALVWPLAAWLLLYFLPFNVVYD